MEEPTIINCQNCEEPFEEGFDFCPHCGQKTNEDLTIGVLFYNTISNYFSFDARFLKSFFPLMFKPGYLAAKFIEGKRLLYLHPAQMYLFVSVIFFFIFSFSTRDWIKKADEINKEVVSSDAIDEISEEQEKVLDSIDLKEIIEPLKKTQAFSNLSEEDLQKIDSVITDQTANKKRANVDWGDFDKNKVDSLVAAGAEDSVIYKEMGMSDDASFFERRLFKSVLELTKGAGAGSIVQVFFDSIPLAMFFLLPIFALILKVFYFFKGPYAFHLVFSFYFFSFLFTVMTILFGIETFIIEIPGTIIFLIMLSTFIYFFLGLKRFYGQHWFLTLFKTGVITFGFLLMVIPMTVGILFLFSMIA